MDENIQFVLSMKCLIKKSELEKETKLFIVKDQLQEGIVQHG